MCTLTTAGLHSMARWNVSGVWLGGVSKNVLLCAIVISLVLDVRGERTQIKTCGGCTFWLEGEPRVNATLSRTGSCANDCTGVSISTKGIMSIAHDTFHGLNELWYLDLYNTETLANIPVDAFKDNEKLYELFLNNNALAKIPEDTFKHNIELGKLGLSNNALTSLPVDLLKSNTKLQYVNLYNNPLGCAYADMSVGIFGVPRCPKNCTINTFYDANHHVCRTCAHGTCTNGIGAVNCMHWCHKLHVSTNASTNCTLPALPAQRQTGTGFVSTCSSMSMCNYKGCADIQCNSSLSSYAEQNCNNGVWDYFCSCVSGNTCSTAEGFCGHSGPGGISPGCSPPSPCAAGTYSANGLDYLGDGACKPCDAGTYGPCPGAKSCSPCPPGTSSTVYTYIRTHLLVTFIE